MPQPIKRDETPPEKLYTQAEVEEKEERAFKAGTDSVMYSQSSTPSKLFYSLTFKQYKQQNP